MWDGAGSNPRRGKIHIAFLTAKGNLSLVGWLEQATAEVGREFIILL
jgi:hypothetical protein